MLVTRRKLAVAALGSAAALGQGPPPPIPQTPEQELEAAREQLRRTADALSRFALPMATEPACHFKA
jgi:hypothetical protein